MSSSRVSADDRLRRSSLGAENAENVVLLHDQVVPAVEGDLAAGVLAKQHAVPRLDVEGCSLLSILGDRASAHREDLALLGLLLRAVGDDESAAANFPLFDPLDQDAVVERLQGRGHGFRHGAGASLFPVSTAVRMPECRSDAFHVPTVGAGETKTSLDLPSIYIIV